LRRSGKRIKKIKKIEYKRLKEEQSIRRKIRREEEKWAE
jgi:hypothetical protein